MNPPFRLYIHLIVGLAGIAVVGPPAAHAIGQLVPVLAAASDAVHRSQATPWTLDSIRPR